jgi:molybdate transport system ATP-binding protein
MGLTKMGLTKMELTKLELTKMGLSVDIKKRLGDFQLDISLETHGGVTGLLGASGSGKSMTLMCIAGIVRPDSGRIILNGNPLFDSERRINLSPQQRRIGYLFQNYALFPNMTVRQNIQCGLHHEKDKRKREQITQETIALMQLQGLENHQPSQLSGGQQQRAALARILAGKPDLLMLDEPFSALDTFLREQLQIDMQKLLKRFDKDVLLVTHNRDEAYQMCHNIAMVESGKTIIHKGTKEIFRYPESRYTAQMTGCKNVVAAEKSGEHTVYVPDWGVHVTSSVPVGESLAAIGIRAHFFGVGESQNRFPIQVVNEIERQFDYYVQFRYINQKEDTQDIWWRIPKEVRADALPEELGVAPEDIMLLYR